MAKRRSVESIEELERQQPHKRQRLADSTEYTSSHNDRSKYTRDNSPQHNRAFIQGAAAGRLDKITELTDEILETPATIGDHIDCAGEDIVRLALELNLKLKQWRESKSLDQLRNERLPDTIEQGPVRQYDPKLLETLHETRRATQYRPPLPPITNASFSRAPFTHQGSLNNEEHAVQGLSYERLELLGDAYIELIATRIIYSRFPHLSTGRLSQLREMLVKNETLKEFAERYHFGEEVRIPESLRHLKGKQTWTKILADVFEAYVAAVILSDPVKGFAQAEEWLIELWAPKLLHPEIAPEVPTKAIDTLAIKIMGGGPSYKIDYRDIRKSASFARDGENYPRFGVYFTGWGWKEQYLGTGSGQSKQEAKQRAAKSALENKPLIDEIAAAKQAGLAARTSQRQ
ncbi:MAG: hypothetical protein M1835_005520 [Candelina submexicana]|nr:MAG: hypothetical protein M1835_005520 [Candelina submexicana]